MVCIPYVFLANLRAKINKKIEKPVPNNLYNVYAPLGIQTHHTGSVVLN